MPKGLLVVLVVVVAGCWPARATVRMLKPAYVFSGPKAVIVGGENEDAVSGLEDALRARGFLVSRTVPHVLVSNSPARYVLNISGMSQTWCGPSRFDTFRMKVEGFDATTSERVLMAEASDAQSSCREAGLAFGDIAEALEQHWGAAVARSTSPRP